MNLFLTGLATLAVVTCLNLSPTVRTHINTNAKIHASENAVFNRENNNGGDGNNNGDDKNNQDENKSSEDVKAKVKVSSDVETKVDENNAQVSGNTRVKLNLPANISISL